MSDELIIGLISNLVTVIISCGGWIFTYIIQAKTSLLYKKEKRIRVLENEIRIRIDYEELVCKIFAEKENKPFNSVKLNLRDELENKIGFRPQISKSDLTNDYF